ncbi:transcriptional regulator [Halobacteriales archaeon QH_8_64_26]|nr:MAG: transcriptional regulator [Halobacteriales archaeon QH_8_64_26]
MPRDSLDDSEEPALQEVLDALDDPDCRAILEALDEPMTTKEIADRCGIALSSTYRKVERLADASMLDERVEVRADGHHTTTYAVDIEAVLIALNETREFELTIERPSRTADERLARLWSEVREGT